MKDKRHIKSFNEASENLNISDVSENLKTDEEISIAAMKQSNKFASKSTTDYTIGFIDGYLNENKLNMKKDLQKIQKLIEDLRIEQYHGIEIESMDVKLHFIEMELFKLMDKLVNEELKNNL